MEIEISTIFPKVELEVGDKLPKRSGVYLFYNAEDELLYVGKAKSFFYRLSQHFSGTTNSKGFHKQIKRIRLYFIENEADIVIYELYLINKFKPKYNKSGVFWRDNHIPDYEDELDLKTLKHLFSCTQGYLLEKGTGKARVKEVEEYFQSMGYHFPKFFVSTGRIRPEIKKYFKLKGIFVESNGIRMHL